jgi:quinol monooxygenase YgiN
MSRSSKSGFDRRGVLRGLVAVLGGAGLAPAARAEAAAASGQIVRLSRASFPAEKYEEVKRRLEESQHTLVPALRDLAGCVHYYAAIDRESGTMINVSVWRSLEDADQMRTFAPMLALAESFAQIGVRFERPIINYQTLWQIER